MEEKIDISTKFEKVPRNAIPKTIKLYLYTSQESIELPFSYWRSRLTIFEKHMPVTGKSMPSIIAVSSPTIKMHLFFIKYG